MKSICIKTVSKEKIDFLINQLEKCELNIYLSTYRFKVYDNLIIHYFGEDLETFYDIVSDTLKKCIEYYYEESIIKKAIKQNYFYLEKIEQDYILKIMKKILELPDKKIGYKNKILKDILKKYIEENKAVILEGVVNFRINEYKKILDNIIDISVCSYLDLTYF